MSYQPAATASVATGYAPPRPGAYSPYGTGQYPVLPDVGGQPGAMPPAPPQPQLPTGGPKRHGFARISLLVVAILIAGLLGGVAGALIMRQAAAPTPANQPAAPTYSAEAIRTQNVQLCTSYAIINSAMPKPANNAGDVLPGVSALRLALAENPAASPEIRGAISDVVTQFDAMIAAFGKVRTRGLAEPPTYDVDQAQRVYDRAWDTCQLG